MKFIAIVFSVLFLTGCKKSETETAKSELEGVWELSSSFDYSGVSSFSPGNGNALRFTSSGILEERLRGEVIYSGPYRVEKRRDCYSPEEKNFIVAGTGSDGHFTISGDSLSITSSNCLADGGTSHYRKIQ